MRYLSVRSRGFLCALAIAALVPSSARAAAGGLRCADVAFSVTLSPGDTEVHSVVGVLCSRGSLRHKTVQIALHGATYSHLYWDWPFQPEIYSYVRWATARRTPAPRRSPSRGRGTT
jgi:hypothetical protein